MRLSSSQPTHARQPCDRRALGLTPTQPFPAGPSRYNSWYKYPECIPVLHLFLSHTITTNLTRIRTLKHL